MGMESRTGLRYNESKRTVGSGANQDVSKKTIQFPTGREERRPAFYLSGEQRVRKAKLSVSNQQRNGGL